MDNIELTLIAAVARNGVIGSNGKMPWNIPEDLKRFRQLTLGHSVIMGRKTFDSLGNKPLSKRNNIVISSQEELDIRYGTVFHAFNESEALKIAAGLGTKAFVIGGERIYNQTILLPQTTALEITELDDEYPGDRRFPYIDKEVWKEVSRLPREGYSFVSYTR